jgi:hypothetical protein
MPCGVAAARGVRRLAASVWGERGGSRPSHGMLSGWVEAGALGAGEEGRPLRAGKGRPRWVVPREVVYLQAHPQRGTMLGGSLSVVADWPVFGSGEGGRFGGFGDLLVQRGPAPAVRAQRHRQGVQSPKSAGWAGWKRWMPWESHGPVWRPRESPGELGLQVVPWLRGGSERAGEHGEMGLDFPYMARVVPWWASGGRAAWSGLSTAFPLHLPGLCCRADGGAFHFLTSPHHSRDFAGQSSGNVEG